jgi:hypothetical protein
MLSIPPYIFAIGAFIGWAGLMLTWARHIHEISEKRRVKAVAQGETAPDIRGVSNYERAELRESAHRDMQVTPREKWIGRGLFFGVPAIIITVFVANSPF